MAAALAKAAFDWPFFKIWCGLMLIYVVQVLLAEKEMRAGADKVWEWFKTLEQVFQGIVIFMLLRIFVGSLLGLPPINSYQTLKQVGVPEVISGNTPSILLFELAFAVIAGGLTSDYVKGKGKTIVKTVFVGSLLVFIFQNALPTYAKTWPNRETVSTNLIDHGVAGTGWKGVRIFLFGKPSPPPPTPPAATVERKIVKIGKEKTLHRFPTDGCITIFLRGDWSDYPKGGKISFTDLRTGKVVLYDEPGKNQSSSLPAGDYRICKVDPGAWGVEIWD